ncbi:MAG: hypothetical protein ACQESE_01270 [Nanobdellota archaeon]
MNEWKYIDAKEFIPEYDSGKAAMLEIFLSDNYEHINGRNNDYVDSNLVHQVLIHSYKSPKDNLLITRRRERSYPLSNYNNMSIMYDELILQGSRQESIDQFVDELKEEFL